MGDLFKLAIKTTGDAKRKSGEDITWKDVDYDKLHASRNARPGTRSWNMTRGAAAGDDDRVKVNDSKGGLGSMVFPSTSEVRQSLKSAGDVVESIRNTIDPYTGFSEAFRSNQPTPMSSQPTPLPSSQGSVSPISQARDSFQEDNVTEYMGRPLSDDDDNSPKVGQIL